MKTAIFKKITEEEKRNRLRSIIRYKCDKKVPIKKIEEIVNNINIELQYKINIIYDMEQIQQLLTLKNRRWINDWRYIDSEGVEENGTIVIGNAVFGTDYLYEYNYNGNNQEYEEEEKEPQFSDDLLVITIKRETWRCIVGDVRNHRNVEHYLYIYIPRKK